MKLGQLKKLTGKASWVALTATASEKVNIAFLKEGWDQVYREFLFKSRDEDPVLANKKPDPGL